MIVHFFRRREKQIRRGKAHFILLLEMAGKPRVGFLSCCTANASHNEESRRLICLDFASPCKNTDDYWHVLFLCLAWILLTQKDRYRVNCSIRAKRKLTRISALTGGVAMITYACFCCPTEYRQRKAKKFLNERRRRRRRRQTTYSLWSKVKKWKRPISLSELDVFHYVLSTHQWRKWKLEQTNQELNWPRVLVHIFSLGQD